LARPAQRGALRAGFVIVVDHKAQRRIVRRSLPRAFVDPIGAGGRPHRLDDRCELGVAPGRYRQEVRISAIEDARIRAIVDGVSG